MKRAVILAAALLAAAGGIYLRAARARPPLAPQAAADAAAVLVTLGEGARAAERWDGALRVTGGEILGTAGWHFSSDDSVTGPGRWRASTRRDEVAPYADIHYTEMRPGSRPEVLHHPVGIFLTLRDRAGARLQLETPQGSVELQLPEAGAAVPLLGGRVRAARVPAVEKLSSGEYEDDEPAIAALSDGSLAVAWVAYREQRDRVLLRRLQSGIWTEAEEVTVRPGDIFRCSVVAAGEGDLAVFWSEREGERWQIWGRRRAGSAWQQPERITTAGSNTFHRAAASAGKVFVVWQSFREGSSDIYLRVHDSGRWSAEQRVSDSPANDWEPAVAAAADGTAHIAWDSYDRGDYDIHYRSWSRGALAPVERVTEAPLFEAHAAVAVDPQGRPWVAWDESGTNWGKDQGFLIPVPQAVPLHKERTLRIAVRSGSSWSVPAPAPIDAFPPAMSETAEHPQVAFDGRGALALVFRHWTRRNARAIGSPLVWESYLTRFDGGSWSAPVPLASSGGSIEKHAALAADRGGDLWGAWMSDGRSFATMIPENADVWVARLGRASAAPGAVRLEPRVRPQVESIPVHLRETEDVSAARAYAIDAGGKRYRIARGDLHRHTDVSADFKYDGSMIEVYRYGLDAAAFDYVTTTDHQTGFDQEFTWWQTQKLADLFHVPGRFTPLFAYERSLPFPNGHRNIVFARRGVRTLPIPAEERAGTVGAARLFEHLRQSGGLSMPHSSATAQGTDWRDNDPEVEPLMEIYQGYRTSYEYEGAPRAATRGNPQAQKSGWQPEGFWWNALARGYRLGVQASSDHWSTHISYACLLVETLSRDGLVDAIRRRHAYAATDNIVLDLRARAGGATYLMGDSLAAARPPELQVRVVGTGAIKQIDLVKDRRFIYSARPASREASFTFTDAVLDAAESWYYVRVLQEDGQMAWSSPIWVRKRSEP